MDSKIIFPALRSSHNLRKEANKRQLILCPHCHAADCSPVFVLTAGCLADIDGRETREQTYQFPAKLICYPHLSNKERGGPYKDTLLDTSIQTEWHRLELINLVDTDTSKKWDEKVGTMFKLCALLPGLVTLVTSSLVCQACPEHCGPVSRNQTGELSSLVPPRNNL